MLINVFQTAIFLHEFRRRLFANASHARDIIGAIAHQGFEINQLVWLQVIFFAEGGDIQHLVGGAALGQLHAHLRRQKLEDIAVASGDMDIQALLDGLAADCAKNVISFHIVHRQPRDVEGVDNLMNPLELTRQVVRHLDAVRLVIGINLLAGAQAPVKSDGDVFRLMKFIDFQQRAAETIDRIGVFAFGSRKTAMPQSMIATIGQGMTVYQI